MPMLIILMLVILGLFAYAKKTMTPAPGTITNVSELDSASGELDQVDVDGAGNELNQLDADAATF